MKSRKAQHTSHTQLLAAIIIIAFVIILILWFTKDKFASVDKVMKRNIDSLNSDYDGDKIPDYTDQSPCVAGEDLVTATDGKKYYYFADSPFNQNDAKALDEAKDYFSTMNDADLQTYFKEHNTPTADQAHIKAQEYDKVDPCSITYYGVYFPDLTSDVELKQVTESDTNLKICVMEEQTCAKLLQASYDALKEERKQTVLA